MWTSSESDGSAMFEFDRALEARRVVARRSIAKCVGVWFSGLSVVLLAAALRDSVLVEHRRLVAFGLAWLATALGGAGAAFVVLWEWPVLSRRLRAIGLAPWAVICLVATLVLRGYLW